MIDYDTCYSHINFLGFLNGCVVKRGRFLCDNFYDEMHLSCGELSHHLISMRLKIIFDLIEDALWCDDGFSKFLIET